MALSPCSRAWDPTSLQVSWRMPCAPNGSRLAEGSQRRRSKIRRKPQLTGWWTFGWSCDPSWRVGGDPHLRILINSSSTPMRRHEPFKLWSGWKKCQPGDGLDKPAGACHAQGDWASWPGSCSGASTQLLRTESSSSTPSETNAGRCCWPRMMAFGCLRYTHTTWSEPRRLTAAFLHCRCQKGKQKHNRDGFDYTIPACFLWWVLLGEGSPRSPPDTCPSQATCLWLVFLRCWTILEGQESMHSDMMAVLWDNPEKVTIYSWHPWPSFWRAGVQPLLPFWPSLLSSRTAATVWRVSWHRGTSAMRPLNGLPVLAQQTFSFGQPMCLGLISNTSCEIASHESWSVRAESSSPHHRLDLDGGCVLRWGVVDCPSESCLFGAHLCAILH